MTEHTLDLHEYLCNIGTTRIGAIGGIPLLLPGFWLATRCELPKDRRIRARQTAGPGTGRNDPGKRQLAALPWVYIIQGGEQ